MKRLLAVAAAAAMMVGLAGTADARPAPKTTGGVGYSTQSGFEARASFNAHGTSSSAKGQVQVKNHAGLDFHGTVDCHTQVGNTATFTGEITKFKGVDGNGQGTGYFRIGVEDGGTPGSDGDRITINRSSDPYSNCDIISANRPVDNGNLVVH